MHLKDGLKFYTDLMTDYIIPLKSVVDDFVLARENERDLNFPELKTKVTKAGIDIHQNLSPYKPHEGYEPSQQYTQNSSNHMPQQNLHGTFPPYDRQQPSTPYKNTNQKQ